MASIIVSTSGSLGDLLPFLAVSERLRERGHSIRLVGREEVLGAPLHDRPGVVVFAPLADVLPRCRAIVHHGGYGTTAAALSTGVPSVVMPFMEDQAFYGRRTEAIGAGMMLAPRRRRRLPEALDRVLQDQGLRARCADLARTLATKDGAELTADAFEGLLGSRSA